VRASKLGKTENREIAKSLLLSRTCATCQFDVGPDWEQALLTNGAYCLYQSLQPIGMTCAHWKSRA